MSETTNRRRVRLHLPMSMAPEYLLVIPGEGVCGDIITADELDPAGDWRYDPLHTGYFCNRLPHPDTEAHASVNPERDEVTVWGGE